MTHHNDRPELKVDGIERALSEMECDAIYDTLYKRWTRETAEMLKDEPANVKDDIFNLLLE